MTNQKERQMSVQPGDYLNLFHFGPCKVLKVGPDPQTGEVVASVVSLERRSSLDLSAAYVSRLLKIA